MYIHLAGSRGEKNALDRGREVRVDALQALVAVVLQVVIDIFFKRVAAVIGCAR